MKRRKKAVFLSWGLLLLILLFLGLLLDASSKKDANLLRDLGLFAGVEGVNALNSTLSRAEAAHMLVCLLGAEENARSREWPHPFQDIPAWAEPSISYLFAEGLCQGITQEEFCPDLPCSLQMYLGFVLRALGYSEEAGDYTYEEIVPFARSLGLLPEGLSGEEDFLLDYAVAISVRALSTALRDENMNLFDKLLQEGAIPKEAAKKYAALSMFVGQAEKEAGEG
ncbi:MAG: hypothetical protein Q4B50_00325 [Bacillota bacterium]|nr:hypothetical protein [Bacillota bacterium]